METVYVNGQPSVVSINVNQPGVVSVNQPSTSVVNVSTDFNVNLVDPELTFSPSVNDFHIVGANGLPVNYIERSFGSSFSDIYLNISNTAYMSGDIVIERKFYSGANESFFEVGTIQEPASGWGDDVIDQTFSFVTTISSLYSQYDVDYRLKVRYEVGGSELFVYKTINIESRQFARFYSSTNFIHSTVESLFNDQDANLLFRTGDYDNTLSYKPPINVPYLYILIPSSYNVDEVEAAMSSAEFGISDFTSSLLLFAENNSYLQNTPSGPVVFDYHIYRVNQPFCFDGKRTLRIKLSQ